MDISTAFFVGQMSTCDLELKQSSPPFLFLLLHLSGWISPPDFVPKINGGRRFYTSSHYWVYVCPDGWGQDGWPFLLASCRHFPLLPDLPLFFSLFPFQTYSSQYLPVLSKCYCKCSSEMTLNMCTLTEGIHLVIYFLLPVSCFFVSSFAFRQFRFIFCPNKTIQKEQKLAKWPRYPFIQPPCYYEPVLQVDL